MFFYIGRQPLYNQEYTLFGYDILHRDNVTKNIKQFVDEDMALRSVIFDALTVYGLQELTEGLPAHISFTKNLIMGNLPYMVKPTEMTVELPRDTQVDANLVSKLNELKAAGYKLAMNGYNMRTANLRFNKIVHLFDYVYINVRQHNRLQLVELTTKVKQRSRAKLLAEQIDDEKDFDKAAGLGFSLFQGIFFGMPVCIRKEVDMNNTSYGRLYNELAKPSSNFETVCKLIESDPVLTHMYMQATPTPEEQRNKVSPEIRRRLMFSGTEGLRKWSCLLLLKLMNVNDTYEIPMKAYQRGSFIEQLMEKAKTKADSVQGFYLGVFSLLNQVADTSLEGLLGELRLESGPRNALLGREENEYSDFLRYAISYEQNQTPPNNSRIQLDAADRHVASMYEKAAAEAETAFATLNPFLNNFPAPAPARRR